MPKEYLHFGPFHREIRRTIVSILEDFKGEMQLEELKRLVRERKNYDLQERAMTFDEVESNPTLRSEIDTLFRYQNGVIYLN